MDSVRGSQYVLSEDERASDFDLEDGSPERIAPPETSETGIQSRHRTSVTEQSESAFAEPWTDAEPLEGSLQWPSDFGKCLRAIDYSKNT